MGSIRRKLQITFVTGLLVIIPIAVPVWVFWELFTFVDRLLDPFVGETFPFRLPGLGLLVAVLLVLLMGIVATNVVGRRILAWLDGRPIAFNALSVMEVELDGAPIQVTHLGLVMVDPDVRGQGLSWVLYGMTALVLFARDGLRPKWISNVTQVPAVVGMVSETFSDVYPSPLPGARRSFAHLQLARGIMAHHRAVFGVGSEAGFDEERFVITNAYTGGSDALKKTFEIAPKHRNEIYGEFCARVLDYARGDDVLQLGRIDLAGARRYLMSEVPAGLLPALITTSAMLALQRLVLPLFYWMDDTRAFGSLRPRSRDDKGGRR